MNECKAIAALLTVIAVLLALDLVVKGSRSAEARHDAGDARPEMPAIGGDPYIVKILPERYDIYWRVWSDGRVDRMFAPIGCDFVLDRSYGPVDYPHRVIDAVLGSRSESITCMIVFEDGRVDLIGSAPPGGRCTIEGIGTQSFCIADTDRNGQVDFQDIINVLSEWGECTG